MKKLTLIFIIISSFFMSVILAFSLNAGYAAAVAPDVGIPGAKVTFDGFVELPDPDPAENANPIYKELTSEESAYVRQLISDLKNKAEKLNTLNTLYPNKGFDRFASQLLGEVNALENKKFMNYCPENDPLSSITGADSASASVGLLDNDTINLHPDFWKMTRSSSQADYQAEQELVLLHEFAHTNQNVLRKVWFFDNSYINGENSGEGLAYKKEYMWATILGINKGYELDKVLDQLSTRGIVTFKGYTNPYQTDSLDEALGLKQMKEILKNGIDVAIQQAQQQKPQEKPADSQVDFNLPEIPKTGDTITEADKQNIIKWKDDCIALLNKEMEEDPERLKNRDECLAIPREDRVMTCSNCGNTVMHWWIENSWCCPVCEKWTYPIQLKRADGKTYEEFASERKKIYEDKINEIEKIAQDLLSR
ncbi:MAG: hypothetical protein A4E52_01655 [Pelotomaculum sp. PtaB.Bin013]|uniref:Uncharacterized protein n=1 Tax=Pelotomaculum isophthalicicum JI TaxID=947010 RepID=A0A9X4JTG4_9FIRM|nr:hypothetical protein [Pelotomaculum isophthalicicum]MDF9407405.1 hypothetical protein [Pelotomaculum isophthalicicum JI]OPX85340.1 MAG: hypothetical protein A4E52_01655 [Pelotomaculum sp. PtaB.Bin013]